MSRAGRSSCRAVLRSRTPAALAAKFFETYKTKVKMILDIRKMRIVVVGSNPWWCVSNLYRRLTTHRTGHTSVPGSTSWCLFLRRASPWRRRRRSLCPFVYTFLACRLRHGARHANSAMRRYRCKRWCTCIRPCIAFPKLLFSKLRLVNCVSSNCSASKLQSFKIPVFQIAASELTGFQNYGASSSHGVVSAQVAPETLALEEFSRGA